MAFALKYIELKTGYADNGPAWIGKVKISRTGTTLYFNDHAFQKCNGISGNFVDIESSEEYWISGVKKDGQDRHWAGHGKVMIDQKIVDGYLKFIGQEKLDLSQYTVIPIEDVFPIERITRLLNH
ncbi:Uncharacterised protein [uncultured Clostridium sp.]|nr:Uncharacterised protein [uncultured Clostridium sp.]